ncbi:hypothetical protein RJ639_004976 [Escallonia herrerae]|uniref:Uncharacterized protein n=1 Tax=Escallonia herrerae TaxID=1293975 RepID=A0AA88W2N7_9ASTE|nr:hypothetical protein RJ639_004976 [Escallonia herrerae]
MKAGGGVVFGGPRAAALPTLLLGRGRATLRCYSSSPDHVSFIKEAAGTQSPEHLHQLLKMLQVKGEPLVSPAAKDGLIPLAIPLTRNSSGFVTALLRWPTAPPGYIIKAADLYLIQDVFYHLICESRCLQQDGDASGGGTEVDQYIHRILVEEDAKNSRESKDEVFHAAGDAAKKLYKKGDFVKSQISSLDVYLLQKVGLFPDILERKVLHHFQKGDHVSALVTGEFYTKKEHFPGFGRPFVFNAEVLLKVGRNLEAKDAARGALKSPWWTLGCQYQEVANIAQWEDEQIEYIKDRVTEEGRQEDLKKGKAPAQVALDEAAFLLDLASVEGTWDDYLERIAACYKEAGLHDIADFVALSGKSIEDLRKEEFVSTAQNAYYDADPALICMNYQQQ